MRIPDMTERFPEGMNGVDLTDSFYSTSGLLEDYHPSEEELIAEQKYLEMREEEERRIFQDSVEVVMEGFQVDEKTATLIVKARKKAYEEINKINMELELLVDEILKINGYEPINDIPF